MQGEMRRFGLILFIILVVTTSPMAYGEADLTQQGIAFLKSQRFKEAIGVFSRILKTEPDNANAIFYRGMARYYRGDVAQAIGDYTLALEKDPGLAQVYTSRGVAFFRQGDYRRSQQDLEQALKKNPEDLNAVNQLAWMMAVCPDETYRNGEKALELARSVISVKTTPNYLDTLAAAYAETGRYDDAAQTQRKVIAILSQEERLNRIGIYLDRLRTYEAQEPWREEAAIAVKPTIETGDMATGKIEKQKSDEKKADIQVPPQTPAPAKPTVSVANQTKQDRAKKDITVPPAPTVASSDMGIYPYTIFISTYQDPNVSKAKVLELRKNGDPVFVSHAYFKDSGHWYQIYYGWYKNNAEASAAAEKLKQRHFRKSIVVKKPFAVQAGISSSKEALAQMETGLKALNYPAYQIHDPKHPEMVRLLIGAYSSEIVPDNMLEALKKAGFKPTVVRR